MILKEFNYSDLNEFIFNDEIVNKLNQIYELRGKLFNVQINFQSVLDHLVDIAKVQSTDASNRIEGIYTSDTRLKQLVEDKTQPHNRSEAEISGYRDVLTLIHDNFQYIPISKNSILALHKRLFNYTDSTWGGHFKDSDNQIITEYSDGKKEIRFMPPPSHLTPGLIENLCDEYNHAVKEKKIPALILTGIFIFDFVSVHPFNDGNGRMSRLLLLLTMYKSDFDVGKYISIEQLIEKTKENYYSSLKASSIDWFDNKNDYKPFINYFLSIVLQAYRNLYERIDTLEDQPVSASDLVLKYLQSELRPLSKRDLIELIPQYSEITIKRALSELREQSIIKIIGKGRASKYVLN
ncbi:Fic family protein [Companilactobacillus allii]|uniref:Cell filamentation protein Fic n=1 Tax=Companilactobacillus allii TaxID=1847728 RepID=A0A1P8Q0X9_9LACO|nr:Fic family protein [Companilactobacillus allii]APX71481.1 cell filamentation protein Fic [Companilactobacillus allii]USQ68562.1 Fic family protein [Companilactobacillus allii]